jgi:hypothetical protein
VSQESKIANIKILLRILGFVLMLFSGAFLLTDFMGAGLSARVFGALLLAASAYLLCGAPHLVRVLDRALQPDSTRDPGKWFRQTGGIRYGPSFWNAANWSAPFAHLLVSKEALTLSVSFFGIRKRTFTFPRSSLRRLCWTRNLFNVGLQIEHDVAEFPVFMLFWVSNREELAQGLSDFGYYVSEA